MISCSALFLVFLAVPFAHAQFGMPVMQGFQNFGSQQFDNSFQNAMGNAAGAGQASALQGMATSINQANHEASGGRTRSNSLSANTAEGFNPMASGAAQAGGQTSSGHQHGNQFQFNSGEQMGLLFRRKRQAFGFPGYYGGFGPNSGASANALGGGTAMFGRIQTRNMGITNSNPWGANGFAQGSANGEGQGVNLYNAAMSNSFSGRRKRQAFGFPNGLGMGFGNFGSSAGANSLGGANTMSGNAFTNNVAFTNSNPFSANGFAQGDAGSDGYNSNAWNAASSNSVSGR